MNFCMYTITGCKHQQPVNLNLNHWCCMSRTVIHGYMYISAVAINSSEDMIDMHVRVNCCVSTGTRYYYCLLYHLLY